MASLRIRYNTYYAVWRENGKQIVKTTNIKVGGNKERKLAQATADAMEQSAKGNISVANAIEAIRKMAYTLGVGKKLPTIQEFFDSYKPKGSQAHIVNCKYGISLFLDFLGRDIYLPLDMLTVAQCRDFVEHQLKRFSLGTVKIYKSVLQTAYQRAVEQELVDKNPFSLVSMRNLEIQKRKTFSRLPFTVDEIRKIVTEAESPWPQIVMLCILTGGQRLGDTVCMKWQQVDWDNGVITIKTQKTGKVISTPITPALKKLLDQLFSPYEEYIFPEMRQRYIVNSSHVSNAFTIVLKQLGIINESNFVKNAKGSKCSNKSFHSLRHSVVSMLRTNASFSTDLIRDTVGHDSEKTEQGYYTANTEAKRTIIDFLAEQISPPTQADGDNHDATYITGQAERLASSDSAQ